MATYPKTNHLLRLAAITLLVLLPVACARKESPSLPTVESISSYQQVGTTDVESGPLFYQDSEAKVVIDRLLSTIQSASLEDEGDRNLGTGNFDIPHMFVVTLRHVDGTSTRIRQAIECEYPDAWRYGTDCDLWQHRWAMEHNGTLHGIHSKALTDVWEYLRGP